MRYNKSNLYDIRHPALLSRYEVMFEFILNVSEVMFRKNKKTLHLKEINRIINNLNVQEEIEYIRNWYGIITYLKKMI